MSFVHLRLHTEYSLENGLVRIEKKKSPSPLMEAVEAGGMQAVAVTDLGNLFAAVKFFRAATGAGIKPIFGAEVRIHPEEESGLESRLVLLAQDNTGFKNIKTLLSRSFIEGQRRGAPQLDRPWFEGLTDGVIALSGGRSGDIGQALLADEQEEATQRLQFWSGLFPNRFYLELQRTERSGDENWNHGAVALAEQFQLPVVATNDVHFLKADEFDAHEARVCIHDGRVLDDPRRPKHFTEQQYLKSAEEMTALFADLPEALENSVEIAKRCNVELSLGKNYLPDFPIPQGMSIEGYFNQVSEEGLEARLVELFETSERIAEKRAPYDERLKIELDVINGMGFPGYFLIVADFIRWSKENGIPVGPGRGSGAGSLVAYALLITDLDPLEYELLFERFLNPERVSMPDFDVDFCMDRRDEVIRYVAETYGIDRVSQIITYGRMNAKAVVRDVGRVQGHPYGMVDRVAKLIPFDLGMTLDKALAESDELRERYEDEEDVHELIELARALEGVARNAGKHAGGVVISPSDINDFSPIYCEENGSGLVTQFDKDDVEAVGLVKFDFLGLRTLTIIDWAIEMIDAQRKLQGEQSLDISKISLQDKSAFELLQAAQTTAVFQLESSGMKELIAKLQPDCFEDIVALVALYRPGPLESGMVDNFIDRKHGREEISYPDVKYQHDSLKTILEPTYGVILYQEQVMQIAQVLAGYTLGGADMLRRAMGKKKPEEMEKQRSIFKEGSINNNVDPDLAMKIFDLVEKFAGYGFNKCLTGDTLIVDPASGRLRTMASIAEKGISTVASLQQGQRMGCSPVADIMENGVKPVFELTTSLGKRIRATANHPLLTFEGWKRLDQLNPGDRIASPRQLPIEGERRWSEHELVVLGWILSEGNTCHPSGFYFYNQDIVAIDDFCQAIDCFENSATARSLREERANTWQVYVKAAGVCTAQDRLGRPAAARSGARLWLESLQVTGVMAADKIFPDPVFELDNQSLALLLGRYWSGDGFLFSETDHSRNSTPYAATASSLLAQQLQHLLLRLGIVSRVSEKRFAYRDGRIGYTVHLVGRDSIEQFMQWIAPHIVGRKIALQQLRDYLEQIPKDRESIDTLPSEVKQWVQRAKEESGLTWRQVEARSGVCVKEMYGADKSHKKGFRRATIEKLGRFFDDESLLQAADTEIFWERVESITPDGSEMTYDLEVGDTHNFVANDIIVHNSHSAAYALVSYQTAWLKAHYPAPFMAAVLSADMDNTDKVVTLIEECRTMELVVHPPGINRSRYKFTVQKQNGSDQYDVVYGIGAIKGVGEAAIEGIIDERETSGPYTDLFDFCKRIDLRKANKRVMESLIRAGALDEIAPPLEGQPLWESRATLMKSLPDAMQAAEQHVRDQERGQGDLFGGDEEVEASVAVSYQPAKPWSEDERLVGERDTLGLYLTGHPIDQHEEELSHIITERMNRLAHDRDKMVTLAGLLISMRVVKTRSGKPLAILVLDDRTGRLEMTLFAESYEKYRHLLEKDAILVVQGTVTDDDYTGGLRMNTEELWNLDGARAAWMKRLVLKLNQSQLQGNGVHALEMVIKPFCEGHIPVRIDYRQPAATAQLDMGPEWNVQPSGALFQRLREHLGDEMVVTDYG